MLNSFLIAITAAGAHEISKPSSNQYSTLPMESYLLDGLAPIKNYVDTPAASKTLPDESKDEPPDRQQAI